MKRELSLPNNAQGRLDAVLARLLPGISRRRLKQAFSRGKVLLQGRPCKGSSPASPGAHVMLVDLLDWEHACSAAAAKRPKEASPEPEIAYRDDEIVVVEKPAGVPSYPLEPGEGGTIVESILRLFPDVLGVGDLPNAPGLCHRLDIETSGLLLFARSTASFEMLRRQFRERQVKKTYLSVADGILEGEGTIEVPISRRSSRRMLAGEARQLKSWPAMTHWEAMEQGGRSTLVRLRLETGVTHQARIHMAWLGHPILGDAKYGGSASSRLALHAQELGFIHPRGGAVLFTSRHEALIRSLLVPLSS